MTNALEIIIKIKSWLDFCVVIIASLYTLFSQRSYSQFIKIKLLMGVIGES